MPLDKIDKGILTILQQNAKITTKAIAEQLNLTTTPIHERIKRMERRGIISKQVVLVDPRKIDRKMTVFISISLKEHHRSYLEKFEEKINRFSEVMECYHITGSHDFLLKIVVKDMEQYQAFVLDKLSVLPSIANVQSSFVLSTPKHTTAFSF